ncbi:hypothetical protein [Draconibacterium halophilum]|uniref:Uncharacterized protein n=1 Tax=Draconibacterium halophilum TaxID=2706887 RepID=A0A6C0RGL6_9BACT|nr:hypothetical protein [Draconibacterium halophilum]QIA08815.1 hypothetical protein G0Q07_14280 [Draconibacterium halophilum]
MMNKGSYNKIVGYIGSMENQNEIKPSELSEIINVNKKEIDNVFKSLLEKGKAIDLTGTELETTITYDKKVNYSELIKKSSINQKIMKGIIGIGIVLGALWTAIQFYEWATIKYNARNEAKQKQPSNNEKLNENYHYIDSISE